VEAVSRATHGLEIYRVGRVVLDLLAQPIDLDIDAALAVFRTRLSEIPPADRHTRPLDQNAEQIPFPGREPDRLAGAAQLAAGDIEDALAELDLAGDLLARP